MIQLLIEGWYEPIHADGIHGSTLVQQILSSLYQHWGMQAGPLWSLHCATGPFPAVAQDHFVALLRYLGQQEIFFQDPTELMMLAPKGERIAQHYTFYAAFSSDEEYCIVTSCRSLGSMPSVIFIAMTVIESGQLVHETFHRRVTLGGQFHHLSKSELLAHIQSQSLMTPMDGAENRNRRPTQEDKTKYS